MKIKFLVEEDFVNYKKPSMFIGFPTCNWKCEKECGKKMCQNSHLAATESIEISYNEIVKRYVHNPIIKAIVFGGLEPFDSTEHIIPLIELFREFTNDDIVIYTGYIKEEILSIVEYLKHHYSNVIIKFGRYIPDQQPHYDEVLGVNLASDNQYAERIC